MFISFVVVVVNAISDTISWVWANKIIKFVMGRVVCRTFLPVILILV
ncbi:MAG: hypothetical protein ACTHKK_07945 [Candidatus Nitrosocosmicus sp.]